MPTSSPPSFSQLRAFVALCDHQHFGEAAATLGVSQPSLSQAITALEKRVGGELVERTTRRVLVTPLGETLLPYAREAVLSAESFNDAVASQGAALTGTMRLGLIPTLAPYMAPVILDGLPAELPSLHPELREMVTGDILDMLSQGRLDAAVIAIDVDLPPAAVATTLSTVVRMVVHGVGITVVPEGALRMLDHEDYAVARFAGRGPVRRIGIVHRTSSSRSEDFTRLAKVLTRLAADAGLPMLPLNG